MQKGQTLIFLLIGVLVLVGGAFYLGRQTLRQDSSGQATPKPSPATDVTSQNPQPTPIPSPTPVVNPTLTDAGETANWKTYTNSEAGYSLKYPNTWYFKKYEQNIYKSHAIFQNLPFEQTKEWGEDTSKGFVLGEIKLVTTEGMRGLDWKNISEKDFFNPNDSFWLKGSGIGGGPGFTYLPPQEVTIGHKRAILQISHPDKTYEFTYPDQITNYYYIFIGNQANEVLMISFTYDEKNKDKESNVITFNRILSTFKFL